MTETVDNLLVNRAVYPAEQLRTASSSFKFLPRYRLKLASKLLDFAIIVAAAAALYPASGGDLRQFSGRYVVLTLGVAFICQLSFAQAHLFETEALINETKSIKKAIFRWVLIFTGLAAISALGHLEGLFSRIWFGSFFVVGLAGLTTERVILAAFIRSLIQRGHTIQSVLVVGDNDLTFGLIDQFAENRSGIRFLGVFNDENSGLTGCVRGVPRLGDLDSLISFSQTHPIDLVVVTLPINETARISATISKLVHQPLNIRVLPGFIGLDQSSPMRLSRSELPGVQLIAVAEPPISEIALFVKSTFDKVAAFLALLFLSPLLFFCAVGISLANPGPVLFRQSRIGYKGQVFGIFKFRTMDVVDHPHIHLTKRNDPRVFKFGAILRKYSLDELPQLINVLRGEMSLVGPRPHMPEARADGKLYFDAVEEYAARHRVKPGITGWAQVNGWRGPTETLDQIKRRVEHDVFYINNWSLTLDIIILIKTVLVGFFGKNAF